MTAFGPTAQTGSPCHQRSPAASAAQERVEPFLHVEDQRIYNPLEDRAIVAGEPDFAELLALAGGAMEVPQLTPEVRERLVASKWVVPDLDDLGTRYRLKYVSFEAHTVCNQGCYFCPVSEHRREPYFMATDFYESVVQQLAEFKSTIEGVSMIHYNEPTADKRFVDQVKMLKSYGLPPAVLTNGTGLTPKRVDAIMEAGGVIYLSINLSTLDRERYAKERDGDHLKLVMRNLDYMKDLPLAPQMEIVVLGKGDAEHKQDMAEIEARFAGSRFEVKYYEVMDRAGNVGVGIRPPSAHVKLRGCEQTGSRPLQWAHITPHGKLVLCCQDYHDHHVVGNLHEQSLAEILEGPEIAKLRRWVYGVDEAPADFICRNCIYALTR